MGKVLLAILIGVVGAGIVHIAVIFALPSLAQDNNWGRIARTAEVFESATIAPDTRTMFPFFDPAFEIAVCRFALASGPVRITAQPNSAFWSTAIFTRAGDNSYSINQRSALDNQLDLAIGSQEQLDEARIAGFFDEASAIPVPFNASEGYVILRSVAEEPSLAEKARDFVSTLSCTPLQNPNL
ncbi:hypothetical protein FPY71_11640 [Aureimonas fodinaquatilis]|uniref:DUF1254 domain-containing protein n=1 Tax=Aureimonas fodinaquatilis TaxID=2565783 RepID=A0A5B0DZW4_9HYPH|nr:hypothetical protein [Aureimonas fodinaquatilis]KAA0971090.1 hypothetical protein FPY71_11640 [Aureimonas fodinaquatilis]